MSAGVAGQLALPLGDLGDGHVHRWFDARWYPDVVFQRCRSCDETREIATTSGEGS